MRFPEEHARRRGAAVLVLLSLLGSSCGASSKRGREQPALQQAETEALLEALPRDAPAPGALRIRLVFGADADLDLFVTDPAQETVYFANSPSRSGGRLTGDVRCGDPAPHIETIVFRAVEPGRYRIGVDYPRPCEGHEAEASFAVVVDGPGVAETRRGVAVPHVFQPVVLEVDTSPGHGVRLTPSSVDE